MTMPIIEFVSAWRKSNGSTISAAAATAEALETFAATLRVYALKVIANVEVDEPETSELSRKLLEPLLHWKVAPRSATDMDKTYY